MKRSVIASVAVIVMLGSPALYGAQISPSPLVSPEFTKQKSEGRGEVVYINYDSVHGLGLQGAKRYPLSDQFALTPSLGVYHLQGDHRYSDSIAGNIKHEIDYNFVSGGLRAEAQHRHESVNFILFGGALLHYGKSDDTTTSDEFGKESMKITDKGVGWEIGAQASIQTGTLMTTIFYKYDEMRVDSSTKDSSSNQVVSDQDQKFTFKSSTVGIDLLFPNGVSLSGLYSMPDRSNSEDITIIKLGFAF